MALALVACAAAASGIAIGWIARTYAFHLARERFVRATVLEVAATQLGSQLESAAGEADDRDSRTRGTPW